MCMCVCVGGGGGAQSKIYKGELYGEISFKL